MRFISLFAIIVRKEYLAKIKKTCPTSNHHGAEPNAAGSIPLD